MKNTANTYGYDKKGNVNTERLSIDENSAITTKMDEANKGNELDEKVQKINALHTELTSLQNQGKQKTIEIGGLLSTVWDELPYSEIDNWTKNRLAFSERTARMYMGSFAKKDKELWQNFKL